MPSKLARSISPWRRLLYMHMVHTHTRTRTRTRTQTQTQTNADTQTRTHTLTLSLSLSLSSFSSSSSHSSTLPSQGGLRQRRKLDAVSVCSSEIDHVKASGTMTEQPYHPINPYEAFSGDNPHIPNAILL